MLFLESHIRSNEDNQKALANIAKHLIDNGLLIVNIISVHKNAELELKDGYVYSQKVNYQLPWLDKEYFVKKDGKIFAHQKCKYKVFSSEEGYKLLKGAGFDIVGLDESGKYIILRKNNPSHSSQSP